MGEKILYGIGASPGIVTGVVFHYEPVTLKIPSGTLTDMEHEIERFHAAQEKAQRELALLSADIARRGDAETAAIFDAHCVLVNDPLFVDAVHELLRGGKPVEAAVYRATHQIAELLRSLNDSFVAMRAADMLDVGQRIIRIMLNLPDTSLSGMTAPAVIVAEDLSPSDTAKLTPNTTIGICLAAGGATSHAAILARTLRIPAVVGLGKTAIKVLESAETIALDGITGEVVVNPSPETLERYGKAQERHELRTATIEVAVVGEAMTSDGRRVEILANVGDDESVCEALKANAEGVGLLRTEFLYLNSAEPPSEEEQVAVYSKIFARLNGRPITVRTLDVGGDKPPKFMDFPVEVNPFLGWRGIRVSLERPDLFKDQIRAILRAAVGHNVQIMYPMVESVSTLRAANHLFSEIRASLDQDGLPYSKIVPVGVMIETPSAAVIADLLLRECDFVSLGTNDLTQYTLAADRANEHINHYFRMLSPSLLRLIQMTIHAAHQMRKPLSICGEMAGYPAAIPILLGLGIERFSMVSTAIPEVKWIIQNFTIAEARQVATQALLLSTADEIKKIALESLDKRGLL